MLRSLILGSCLAAAALVSPLAAQTRAVPDSSGQVKLSYSPIVKQTAPSVVNVYGARIDRRARNRFMEDEFFRRFFGDGGFGIPQERVQRSLGSGVVVDPSGLVVTNHHVIEGMTEVKVALADRREYEAEIVLRDPRTDLAVLKLKGADKLQAITIGDADALEVGDLVLAIGNPFGVGQTVTSGIVSALARTQVGVSDYQFFIQTDAAINPGNSGGALVDMTGKLIGINTAIFSRSGGSIGIGFAIPASMVRVVVESARDGGKAVRRPWFGATMQTVSADIADSLGLPRPTGVLISKLFDKGPAAEAGLKVGDVILAVDGQPVDDPDGFGFRFATKVVGGTASLTVQRAGQKIITPIKLAVAPETRPRDQVTLAGRTPFAGASVVNLSPAVAEELSLNADSEGVAVADIEERSIAAQVGFQKGDIFLEINGAPIKSTRDLDRLTRERGSLWRVTLNRGGQVISTVFGG